MSDSIDRVIAQWERERPDLDCSGFEVAGRVLVLARHLDRRVKEALRPLGLAPWAFDVLATLRRQGAPYRLTPSELARSTLLTSGAMTNRLDRLERDGWIRRGPDPQDRRGVLVVLTEEGREIAERAVEIRLQEARDAVAPLGEAERKRLAASLSVLLQRLETTAEG